MPDRPDGDGVGGELLDGADGVGGVAFPRREARLLALLAEFRRRQRRRPDLAVRPWWTAADGNGTHRRSRLGFVVEYCPAGHESAEVVVRLDRVTVEGPAGVAEAVLDLDGGWLLEGSDTGSPETLANYLLRLADRTLGGGA